MVLKGRGIEDRDTNGSEGKRDRRERYVMVKGRVGGERYMWW